MYSKSIVDNLHSSWKINADESSIYVKVNSARINPYLFIYLSFNSSKPPLRSRLVESLISRRGKSFSIKEQEWVAVGVVLPRNWTTMYRPRMKLESVVQTISTSNGLSRSDRGKRFRRIESIQTNRRRPVNYTLELPIGRLEEYFSSAKLVKRDPSIFVGLKQPQTCPPWFQYFSSFFLTIYSYNPSFYL